MDKLINFNYLTNSEEYIFHTDKLGHFGDFIGGFLGTILTGVATYFVYKTYVSQKDELEKQKEELILNRQLIAQQQFESTFFNMLSVHRELKNSLILDESKSLFFETKTNYEILHYNLYEISPDNSDTNQQEARRDKFSKVIKNGIAVFEVIRNDNKNLNAKISIEERIKL